MNILLQQEQTKNAGRLSTKISSAIERYTKKHK